MRFFLSAKSAALLSVLMISLSACSRNISDDEKIRDYLTNISSAEKEYESAFWVNRRSAVEKASHYPYTRSERFLHKAVLSDSSIKVRIAAVKALSAFNTSSTIIVLSDAADFRNNFMLRLEALNVLASFRSPAATDTFSYSMDDANWLIRESAIKGLISIDHSKISRIQNYYFRKAVEDDSPEVRVSALKNAEFKDMECYEAAKIQFMGRNGSESLRLLEAYLVFFQEYPLDKGVEEEIKKLLLHDNSEIRIAALRTLKSVKFLAK